MKYLLMIPGPVESPGQIIEAFNGQTVAHYGAEFRDLYLDTVDQLSAIMGTEGQSYLIPGSGSTALEAIGANFCHGKKCLVINNGHFGDRIYDIAKSYAAHLDQIIFPKGSPCDLEAIEQRLQANSYDVVWMVHVDTSIGILNPIREVAALAKKYKAWMFVDAIASGGIEEIKMDQWGIDAVANATQKGLACPAGFGLLTAGKEILSKLDSEFSPTTWCLNLKVWVEYYHMWNDWHPFPVSLPTNLVKALKVSLDMINQQGIENRLAFYRQVSEKLIKAILVLGLGLFVPRNSTAHGLTAVSTGGKFDASQFKNFLVKNYNIMIGGSLDEDMKTTVFRIGHMSTEQCLTRNLAAVISGLGAYMRAQGLEVNLDDAIAQLQ